MSILGKAIIGESEADLDDYFRHRSRGLPESRSIAQAIIGEARTVAARPTMPPMPPDLSYEYIRHLITAGLPKGFKRGTTEYAKDKLSGMELPADIKGRSYREAYPKMLRQWLADNPEGTRDEWEEVERGIRNHYLTDPGVAQEIEMEYA